MKTKFIKEIDENDIEVNYLKEIKEVKTVEEDNDFSLFYHYIGYILISMILINTLQYEIIANNILYILGFIIIFILYKKSKHIKLTVEYLVNISYSESEKEDIEKRIILLNEILKIDIPNLELKKEYDNELISALQKVEDMNKEKVEAIKTLEDMNKTNDYQD